MSETAEDVGLFCYSTDEERYEGAFSTREDALEEARDEHEPPVTIWTARAVPFVARIDAERTLEQLSVDAYDEVGEYADAWLEKVSNVEKAALTLALSGAFAKWAKANGHEPKFYGVTDVQEHAPEVPA